MIPRGCTASIDSHLLLSFCIFFHNQVKQIRSCSSLWQWGQTRPVVSLVSRLHLQDDFLVAASLLPPGSHFAVWWKKNLFDSSCDENNINVELFFSSFFFFTQTDVSCCSLWGNHENVLLRNVYFSYISFKVWIIHPPDHLTWYHHSGNFTAAKSRISSSKETMRCVLCAFGRWLPHSRLPVWTLTRRGPPDHLQMTSDPLLTEGRSISLKWAWPQTRVCVRTRGRDMIPSTPEAECDPICLTPSLCISFVYFSTPPVGGFIACEAAEE